MAGTNSLSSSPERSATLTLEEVRELISWAATWLLSASFLTSVATTAKPLPCSPALAASMAALRVQQVGLVGYFFDDGDFLGDGFHGIDGLGDGFAAFLHFFGAFESHVFHLPAVLRVVTDRSVDLFEARCCLFHCRGLLRSAARQRLR